jgi:hypothetical protein
MLEEGLKEKAHECEGMDRIRHVKYTALKRSLVNTVMNLWLIKGHSGLDTRLLASQKRFFSTELVGQQLTYAKTLLGHSVFNS